MIKLPQKTISLLLALVLLAPANAGAATWMALSMSSVNSAQSADPADAEGSMDAIVALDHPIAMDTEHHLSASDPATTDHEMHPSQHSKHSQSSHHSQHVDHQGHQSHEHDHDEEDCNEHCVSCANHCSSVAIPFDHIMLSDLLKQSQRLQSGSLNRFSDILFRPPIHV